MDFRLDPKHAAFQAEVLDFIKTEMPANWSGGRGIDMDDERSAAMRDIRAKLAKKNWLALAWPKE